MISPSTPYVLCFQLTAQQASPCPCARLPVTSSCEFSFHGSHPETVPKACEAVARSRADCGNPVREPFPPGVTFCPQPNLPNKRGRIVRAPLKVCFLLQTANCQRLTRLSCRSGLRRIGASRGGRCFYRWLFALRWSRNGVSVGSGRRA